MAITYDVYWGTDSENLNLVASGINDLSYPMPIEGILDYGVVYYWRIDATNEYGTTEGDTWSFTTMFFDPPAYSTQEKVIYGEDPSDPEAETETAPSGENNIITVERLVAIADNKFFYEDV